jgi:aminoglycoside/choline kinase family phosphotransferase
MQRLDPPPPHAIAEALGVSTLTVEWLAGDGSDRCYFRIFSPELESSLVLMQLSGSDVDNLRQGRYDWLDISELLSSEGVKVPKLRAKMLDAGALIIEDYGDIMLETVTLAEHKKSNISNAIPYYEQCLSTLSRFLSLKPKGHPCWARRAFDQERFVWELNFFVKKYLNGVLGLTFSAKQEADFARDSQALSTYLSSGSNYFVHRDFHSRNVMVFGTSVAIIDFQDARLGPASYDLVSLCFDSYVPFTHPQRMDLLSRAQGLFKLEHPQSLVGEIEEQWKPMLLQRQLKAIGSFGYLTIDKNKGDYLKNVRPALETLADAGVCDKRWPFLSKDLIEMLLETQAQSPLTGLMAAQRSNHT